jgi:transmembrane sensor
MPEIIDWDRLARYVAHESSPAERAELERWLAADPSRQALLAQVERRWVAAQSPVDVNIDAAWSRVSSRLKDATPVVSDDVVLEELNGATAPRSFASRWALPIAAAVVLAAGVSFWQLTQPGDDTASLAATAGEYRVARGGAPITVTLGDGSEVTLASGSRLVVAADFGNASRSVDLEGEAMFRVEHDAARPFRVRAGNVIAEDLGTEFVVRHLGAVRVAVREGIVAVRSGDDAPARDTLRARDVAIASDSGVLVRRDQDLDAYFAWTRGQLVFDNAPLSEVAAELSRWFDIDVVVADSSIANRTLNVTLLSTTPVDEILQIVGSSTDIRVERQGRSVRFTGPGYTGEIPMRTGTSREVAG